MRIDHQQGARIFVTGLDRDRPNPLLGRALAVLGRSVGEEYTFTAVQGATQARVWKGTPRCSGPAPDLALRLTPKPIDLIRRISMLIDQVERAGRVGCPRTVAVEELEADDQRWTVHLCTWIGTGPAGEGADVRRLGVDLAHLHAAMSESAMDFSDRPLNFEHPALAPSGQPMPAWWTARNLWQDRILAWHSSQDPLLGVQPIHGDMHWGNIVQTTTGGFAFIDFDKVMSASPVFDLAKLIATGLFQIGDQVQFQAHRARDLLAGYASVRKLSQAELVALEGLAVLLNEETARLGQQYGIQDYIDRAEAIATWWIARYHDAEHDPLGIRTAAG